MVRFADAIRLLVISLFILWVNFNVQSVWLLRREREHARAAPMWMNMLFFIGMFLAYLSAVLRIWSRIGRGTPVLPETWLALAAVIVSTVSAFLLFSHFRAGPKWGWRKEKR